MSNDYPKISVVVPVFNQAPYLEQCLRSLTVEQTYEGAIEVLPQIEANSIDLWCLYGRILPFKGYSCPCWEGLQTAETLAV